MLEAGCTLHRAGSLSEFLNVSLGREILSFIEGLSQNRAHHCFEDGLN